MATALRRAVTRTRTSNVQRPVRKATRDVHVEFMDGVERDYSAHVVNLDDRNLVMTEYGQGGFKETDKIVSVPRAREITIRYIHPDTLYEEDDT